MRHAILLLFCLFTMTASAQQKGGWQDMLHSWLTAEDAEESYGEETMELLENIADNPINLNQVTREELEQLPFLTAQQVEGIMEYVYRYGPVRSIGELQMVTSLDYDTRRLLEHFVCIGEQPARSPWPKLSDVAKYGRHSLTLTGKIPFYQRKGDENGYLGYPYRHDLRYQFTYNDRLKIGLTAAQDAGEPFFSRGNRQGYDHYAYYFQLRHTGRLEALNLGMFRVQLGMGLIMNSGFRLGKLASLQSMGRSTHALTAHSSRSAANYLRGAAATVRIGNRWHVTAYASYRGMDATLNDDGTARTLLYDGYHRTPLEISKKHNTHATDLGGSVGYRKGSLYVNANVVYTHFDRALQPQKQNALYRRYAAEGQSFTNASLDYGYTNSRFTIAGETAVNKDGAIAALHTVGIQLGSTLSLMVLHRYYDKKYTALHARSFSENSSVQNEHGIYAGINWHPTPVWLIQAYADYAHFAWARYQASAASDAFDAMLTTRYSRKRWTIEGRYRMHLRQRDNTDKTMLVNRYEHRGRLRIGLDVTPQLSLQTQADAVCMQSKTDTSKGIMLSEHATWQWRWLKADACFGWFRTDDYDSRIYMYERSVQNDYSFPMYYGRGLRYAVMLRADIGRRFVVAAKVGVTNYFDRSTIASGLQTINRSSMADMLVQLRCKL